MSRSRVNPRMELAVLRKKIREIKQSQNTKSSAAYLIKVAKSITKLDIAK
jgi:hypothetical protein